MNYLIWDNIYLAVFYGFYWLFLRKETFFQVNRGYLLSSIVLSFILPLLNLKDYFFTPKSDQFIYTLSFETQANQMIIPSVNAENNWFDSFSSLSILTFIYVIGCLFFFIKFLYQAALIKRKLKSSYPKQAYSLFHFIRVDPDLVGYSKIVEHEKIHAKQFHSLDILLIELIKIACWFYPLVYLLHRSVKLNHEYIADEIANSHNNDRADYAQILLSQAFGTPIHSLTNSFFNESFIKKCIAMLFKNKSKKLVLSRFFILIPVLILIMAFQTNDPILSRSLVKDFDNNASFEALLEDTSPVFTAVEMPLKEAEGINVKEDLSVNFIAEKDGRFSNIKINGDLNPRMEEALIRMIENSPNNKAGIQNKNERRVQFTFPIVLNQEGNNPSQVRILPKTESSLDIDSLQFTAVEEPPVPPGGMSEFLKYIGNNYIYPEEAIKAKVSGRIKRGITRIYLTIS